MCYGTRPSPHSVPLCPLGKTKHTSFKTKSIFKLKTLQRVNGSSVALPVVAGTSQPDRQPGSPTGTETPGSPREQGTVAGARDLAPRRAHRVLATTLTRIVRGSIGFVGGLPSCCRQWLPEPSSKRTPSFLLKPLTSTYCNL